MLVVFLCAAMVVGTFLFYSTSKLEVETSQELAEKEIEKIVTKVGQIVMLPSQELPQVATVEKAKELAKTQIFFEHVRNGDQILIYMKEKQIIIYRPSEHKLINMGGGISVRTN